MNAIKKILITGILIFLCRNAHALNVLGEIPNGTIWSIVDSPINVVGDLNIVELTIEPGVEIRVTGDYEIKVSGVISSLGNEESPVLFKPSDDNTTGWRGLYFEDTIPGSVFRWTQIKGANSSGVHIVRSNPSFDHVTFQGNRATYGGAIRAEISGDNLRITNSLFVDNFASTAGGAIYTVGPTGPDGAVLEVTESVFRQNNVGTTNDTMSNTSGGAIHIEGNSVITGSTFTENEARAYTIYALGGRYTRGGAVYIAQGRSEIKATTFMGNACRMGAHSQTPDASRAYGGAVYLASGELLLSNDLLVNNKLVASRNPDYRGGGVFIADGDCNIINSTLMLNDIHAVYRNGGLVEILNSILFFNNNSGEQVSGSVLATYSAIQNGFSGEGNISFNPIFNGLFAILPTSPAIDAGNPGTEFDDLFPPGQGSARNDLGYTGGPATQHWNNPVCYLDADRDGYGDPNNFVYMPRCTFDYVTDNSDCDDRDPTIFPGAGDSCPDPTTINGAHGFISNGTIWSIVDSPINVVGDLNIVGLTIEPGVEIRVTGDYEIKVSGVISSLGNEESPVVFKPSDDNTTGWRGLYFEDTIPGSAFRWTQIKGANSSGVHIVRSNPSFDHVTFQGNRATYGGAIRAEISGDNLRITNSLFVDNFASTAGGAIYTVGPTGPDDAVLEVTESVFRQNNVGTTNDTMSNTSGGAIHIEGNSVITGSTFTENEARAYTIYALGGRYTRGGAVYIAQGRSEIKATTFMGNACRMGAHSQTPDASRAYGGAVYLASGELLLSNDLLVNNKLVASRNPDYRGGGVFIADGDCNIINSTLMLNDIHAVYRNGGLVEILNSILFFNNNSGEQISGSVLATYSAIQNGFSGEGNTSADPIFNADFQLSNGSPCIDTGSSSGAPSSDIEGKHRPQGKGYDMGAYEFSIFTPMPWLFLLLDD